MMLDKKLLFCEAKAFAATGETDVLDLDQACIEQPLRLFVAIPKGASGAGSFQIGVQTGDAETASNAVASYALTNDMITKGGIYAFGLPKLDRYAKLKLTISGTVTDCKITAGLAMDVQTAV